MDNGYLQYTCGNCGCGGSVTGDCSCDEIFLELSKVETDVKALEDKVEELELSGVTPEKVEEILQDYTYDKDKIDEKIGEIENPDDLVASLAFENNSIVAKNKDGVDISTIPASDILSLIRVENNTLIIP